MDVVQRKEGGPEISQPYFLHWVDLKMIVPWGSGGISRSVKLTVIK
jgi:hypothetical protein